MAKTSPNCIPFSLSSSIVTLVSGILFLGSAMFYIASMYRPPSTLSCVEVLYPGAMAKDVIEYRKQNFIDFFVPRSILRGPPEAQRELEWDRATPYGVVELENVPSLKDRNGQIYVDSEPLAIPGFSLHLNCLKMIRRYVYLDVNQTIYEPPTRARVDSCIELLRRELLCAFDTTPYLMANTERTHRGVIPSVSTSHLCRNHERLADWTRQNLVTDSRALTDWVDLDV